jgi:hypothetical protein
VVGGFVFLLLGHLLYFVVGRMRGMRSGSDWITSRANEGDHKMKTLVVLLLIGALAWWGYGKYRAGEFPGMSGSPVPASTPSWLEDTPTTEHFSCDGRTHCSHMRSCAEATYFLRNCPNTKMDGDGDGVPCERQWCN